MTNHTTADAMLRVSAARERWSYDPSEEYLRALEVSLHDWLDEIRLMRRTIAGSSK